MVCPRYKGIAISGMCVFAAHIVMAQVQDAGQSSAEETARLIRVIESDAALHDKAMACRRLAVIDGPRLAALGDTHGDKFLDLPKRGASGISLEPATPTKRGNQGD